MVDPGPPSRWRHEVCVAAADETRDRRWAKWLHDALADAVLPDALARRLGRDAALQGTLLACREPDARRRAEVARALEGSRHLVVVCSPRTPASAIVRRALGWFRRRDPDRRVVAVLVEGAPEEALPAGLRDVGEEGEREEVLFLDARSHGWESREADRRAAVLAPLLAFLVGAARKDLPPQALAPKPAGGGAPVRRERGRVCPARRRSGPASRRARPGSRSSPSGAPPGGRPKAWAVVVLVPVLLLLFVLWPRGGGDEPPGGDPLPVPTGARHLAPTGALDRALRWIAVHQSPHGGWEAEGFAAWCDARPLDEEERPGGAGDATFDLGVTSLAILALLGADRTLDGPHPYDVALTRGVAHLLDRQEPDGRLADLRNPRCRYGQALGALALVAAAARHGRPRLTIAAQQALEATDACLADGQDASGAPAPGLDATTRGWLAVLLLEAEGVNARAAGRGEPPVFVVSERLHEQVRSWSESVASAPPVPLEDAPAALLSYLACDAEGTAAREAVAGALADGAPRPGDAGRDAVAQTALALRRVGGDAWARWREAFGTALLPAQRAGEDPCGVEGSWDGSGAGGRLHATALVALALTVHAGAGP